MAVVASETKEYNRDVSDYYDRAKEIKEFDETKAGVKGLVDSGITKIPRFFIQSPENQPKVEELRGNGTPLSNPVINLDGVSDDCDRRKFIVEEIKRASETWGFFQMVNHGIPVHCLDEMIEGVKRFHEQPTEVKKHMYSRDLNKKARFSTNVVFGQPRPLTWKDTLACTLFDEQLDYEELPSVCRDIMIKYVNCMAELKETLLELLSEALGLNKDYLKGMDCMKTQFILGHYYPPCPEPDLTIGTRKHSDPTFLTIVLQDDTGGLQFHHQNQWVNVSPKRGALVVNIGDLLQLITNDKFKSMDHRVLAGCTAPRVSVATCFFPNSDDAKLYGPIKQLVSEDNPPVYREISASGYCDAYKSAPKGNSPLPHLRR